MYFTHCFQISFILKSSNLKFSALCLDSTDCICLVCPTPPVLLSLTEKCVVGEATNFTCFLTLWTWATHLSFSRFVVQTECDWRLIAKYCENSWALGTQALLSFPGFSCCMFSVHKWQQAGDCPRPNPSQWHYSNFGVHLGLVFNTFSRSYCATRAELRGEGLVHPPVLLLPLRRFCSYWPFTGWFE